MGDEALVGTPGPVGESEVEGEVMSLSPIGRPLMDPDTHRRSVALDMAIDARARDAEKSEDVLDIAKRYEEFLRGG